MIHPNHPVEEQLAEARRELSFRRKTFSRWVSEGKMTEHVAERRIGLMMAIVRSLEGLADKERLL